MTRRQVDQERRNGERRQTSRPTAVRGAHGISNRPETTNAGTDDGCSALLGLSGLRLPTRLLNGLTRRFHGKQDEPIHLLLFFGRCRPIRVKTRLRILCQGWHRPADLGRQIGHHLVRQVAQPRTPGQQPRPDRFDAATQRRHQPHACHYHSTITHTATTSYRFARVICNAQPLCFWKG